MMRRAAVATVVALLLGGCAPTVTGTPTWPGARLDRAHAPDQPEAEDKPRQPRRHRKGSDSPGDTRPGGPDDDRKIAV